jgi:hypothetical protein
MKALKILKYIKEKQDISFVSNSNINEAIEELEDLENRSCDGCKHLQDKKKHLEYECLIEVCRSCKRNSNDNWEQN